MTSKAFGIQLVCAVALVGTIARPGAAQSMQPPAGGNPFSGLFKGSPADQPHRLDLSGSTFLAWDDNVLAQAPNGNPNQIGLDPRGVRQGIANGSQGAASYGFRSGGTRNQFTAGADVALQEFASSASQDVLFYHSYNAGVGFRTGLTSKTSLLLNGGAFYGPYYQYAPFLRSTTNAESPVGSDYGYAVQSTWVRTTSAAASIENRFSKRSGVSAGVDWNLQAMPANPELDFDQRSALVAFNHNLTRKLGFHIGYRISETRALNHPEDEPQRLHNIDVGLGYGDGLTISFARHYTLSLSIGASIVKNGDPLSVATTGQSTQFLVTGGATLSRSIGRTWGTSIGYTRGTSYVLGFNEPLIIDAANAGIGGPISTRLHFSAGAGASRGTQVFTTTSGDPIITYTASTRLTFALMKNIGVYSQASYYRYSIPNDFRPVFGFTPDLDRRSVSAGLTARLPLIKPPRVRRTDEPPQQDDRDTR